ncbi:MAG: uL15 family ribosomal protein [Candidatus Liptonbacteria bacterium]|nr:uL15 family ribosomal protein [Candidatus Liptonbacteria bacterium]
MQLHQLQRDPSRKQSQRIGRGGKRGSYSGRGVKGQKSRAGRRLRPAVRDLIIRLPKRRGFRNKPKSERAVPLNLDVLARALRPLQGSKGTLVTVTPEVLVQTGIVPTEFRGVVKILGGGEIDIAIEVRGIPTSASAKMKIEKAGGVIANNANQGK